MTGAAARLREVDLRRGAPIGFLVGVLVAVLLFAAVQLANDPAVFFLTFMRSMGLGSTYALIALGFVLIFKATQTVNFAQGALAATGALFVSFLAVDGNIPFTNLSNPLNALPGPDWLRWGLNVIVALAFAAVVGLVIERLAIRPMVGEPLFSVAVITLGLEIIFRVFNSDAVKTEYREVGVPWLANGFKVGDVLINWSFIAAMITAAAVFVAVYFFFRSRLGIAMRAMIMAATATLNAIRFLSVRTSFGVAASSLGSPTTAATE